MYAILTVTQKRKGLTHSCGLMAATARIQTRYSSQMVWYGIDFITCLSALFSLSLFSMINISAYKRNFCTYPITGTHIVPSTDYSRCLDAKTIGLATDKFSDIKATRNNTMNFSYITVFLPQTEITICYRKSH